ncbi:hypothetical protein QQZ08_010024 [Neonectria magnoliae]|uniref:Uncharacterized protein n=1 Tax=Neonectria magnoliae TaxID=2732573 RepID=A0ABR1HKQ4_9HYPO
MSLSTTAKSQSIISDQSNSKVFRRVLEHKQEPLLLPPPYPRKERGTMDEKTKEDLRRKEDIRRMTEALTDQATIDQLSKTGMMARNKREELQAMIKRNSYNREEEMKKEQQIKEDEQIKDKDGDGDGDGKDAKGGNGEEDNPGDGQGGEKQD